MKKTYNIVKFGDVQFNATELEEKLRHHQLEVLFSPIGSADQLAQVKDFDFIILANKSLSEVSGLATFKSMAKKILLISELNDESNIGHLLEYGIDHIIGSNSKDIAEELHQAICQTNQKISWGPGHYLEQDHKIFSKGISSSHGLESIIEQGINHFDYSSFFDSPKEYLRLISNELLTNALYNAPIGKSKASPGLPVDRKFDIGLKGNELIKYGLGMDKNSIIVSVQDSFGTLDRETVVKNLHRSFEQKSVENKQGGAGIGLYMIFAHANQFIVNHKNLLRTEVLCIIDTNKRFKTYRERITSFHFYEEANP